MLEVSNRTFDSERWADTISLQKDERCTAIRGLENVRAMIIAHHNMLNLPLDPMVGRYLADVDRLIDRLKHAEKP